MKSSAPSPNQPLEKPLESWKEIAAYLGKGVRTVVRWEASEGLPVHRHVHERRSSVIAFRSELDAWCQSRISAPAAPAESNRSWRWAALASLVVVSAVVVWWSQRTSVALDTPLNFLPLTSYTGVQTTPSFSPDGNHFAFAWDGPLNQNMDIYVEAIGSSQPKRLTEHPWLDFSPAWSPDGKWIAFLRRSPTFEIELRLVPALGGAERKLADVRERHFMDAPQLSWSPDGQWLAFADTDVEGPGLFMLAPETGEKRRLTTANGPRGDLDPSFSPDGRSVAFRRGESDADCDITVQKLTVDGRPWGIPEKLTNIRARSTSPVWSGDGRHIFFASGGFGVQNDVYRLKATARNAEKAERLTASTGEAQYALAASWRSGLLAYTQGKREFRIYEVVQGRDGWTPPQPVALPASVRGDGHPALASDGQQIAFISERSGHPQLWVAQRDGSLARRLTSIEKSAMAWPAWSPDSKEITFSSWNEVPTVWKIDVAGGPPRKLAENAWSSSWSRDGRWIYYSSATHRPDVFKVPAAGGTAVKVVDHAIITVPPQPGGRRPWHVGNMPVESSDGRHLFVQAPGGFLWRIPLSGERPELLSGIRSPRAICRDGVFYSGPAPSSLPQMPLMFYTFEDGTRSELLKDGPRAQQAMSASDDCTAVLYSRIERESMTLLYARGLW